jgi:hypothetical protein
MSEALHNMSHDRLESIVRNAREKSAKAAQTGMQLGAFAVGAVGTGFVRAKWGMKQILGQDASVVVGVGLVIAGLAFPEVSYANIGMYLGAGMAAEKMIDMGRKWGTPKQGAGGIVGGHVAGYLGPANSNTSAEEGLRILLQARRDAGLAALVAASTSRRPPRIRVPSSGMSERG